MATINGITLPNGDIYHIEDTTKAPYINGIYYGQCVTSGDTQQKEVSISGVTSLTIGTIIAVYFKYAQLYNGAPTLKINTLTAKSIARLSGTNASQNEWQANEVLIFLYDGLQWVIINGGVASVDYYGATKLESSITSTSSDLAATPSSINNLVSYILAGYSIYSSSSTYSIGDRVRYGWQLWECTIAITNSENWNSSHWTPLDPIMDIIEDNKVIAKNHVIASYTQPNSDEQEIGDMWVVMKDSYGGNGETSLKTHVIASDTQPSSGSQNIGDLWLVLQNS